VRITLPHADGSSHSPWTSRCDRWALWVTQSFAKWVAFESFRELVWLDALLGSERHLDLLSVTIHAMRAKISLIIMSLFQTIRTTRFARSWRTVNGNTTKKWRCVGVSVNAFGYRNESQVGWAWAGQVSNIFRGMRAHWTNEIVTDTLWTRVCPIQYLLATCCFLKRDQADIVHHLYLPEFKKAYPEAKLLGVDGTLGRMEDKTFKFDGGKIVSSASLNLTLQQLHSLGQGCAKHEIRLWRRRTLDIQHFSQNLIEIHRCSTGTINLIVFSPPAHLPLSFFSGFKNKDVAFFHPESKTMIQADLLFNLPAYEQVCFLLHMICVIQSPI